MSDYKKSIVAAGWIVAATGAVVIGSAARDRADLANPAHGVDFKNLVASRDVADGGHLQSEIPAGDFFFELTEKLKQEYVEPIGDEQKLASGAVGSNPKDASTFTATVTMARTVPWSRFSPAAMPRTKGWCW